MKENQPNIYPIPMPRGLSKNIFQKLCLLSLYIPLVLITLLGNNAHSANKNDAKTRELPNILYGITIDGIEPLKEVVDSISSLAQRPTTRVVFDEWVPASEYTHALDLLHPKSFIMGEILDSYYVNQYSVSAYSQRVKEYLDAHNDKVDIWEIGNEVNGEWLGNPDHVIKKIEDAYRQVKARNAKAALTLYYNKDCWSYPREEMFEWAKTRLPNHIREGIDYLLVSYYEEDCNHLKPDWQNVFNRLGTLFPRAKLGFGEVGSSNNGLKAEYLKKYYTMKINHPRYIGGHFWWYYVQDMVPKSKPLWSTLNTILKDGKRNGKNDSLCSAKAHSLPNNKWQQISLPCRPPSGNNTITSIFGNNTIGEYGSDWIAYRYDTSLGKYIALKAKDRINQGNGYWIIQTTGKKIMLSMPPNSTSTPVTQSASCTSPQGCFEIPLKTQANTNQWNMLGHPLNEHHTLSDLRVTSGDKSTRRKCNITNACTLKDADTAGITHSQLWHYIDKSTGYKILKASDSINPWDGFWAATLSKSNGSNPTLLIPLKNSSNH